MSFRSKSYAEESAAEGLLFSAWTQTWGLKVSAWYSMDRIKFAFIEKGANGKGKSFDVYVNAKKDFSFDFETFTHELLHDVPTPYDFLKIMAAEKQAGEKYPKRYKFVTGENGEKSVGICNSTNGSFCINGKTVIDGKSVFANIPCSYYDILNIVMAYNESYEERRKELREIRAAGIKNMEEMFRKNGHPAYEEDAPYQEEIKEDAEGPVIVESVIPMNSKCEQAGNGYVFNTANNEKIHFLSDSVRAMNNKGGMFDKLRERITKKDVSLKYKAEMCYGNDGSVSYTFLEFCS